eukprot:CAMPEP_0174338834 /NCGR_PEP_ID=MMETSP0810-20121108/23470_1 /TAXON_ID=73025 ORGANISM="Eutreptiella gymnastica-like, Strain CCMP1594" /NCGR_SAMPLE_ID=MMETSP0810 /ASSEMBLY_ACC=CAM_ASM_000659 /LENGTH=95 /DNA_ID=CAMNT_0015459191 /DNA_START=522 /DNA_END=806 /DNA_ORIENTATION=+
MAAYCPKGLKSPSCFEVRRVLSTTNDVGSVGQGQGILDHHVTPKSLASIGDRDNQWADATSCQPCIPRGDEIRMHGIAARTPGHKYTGKWPQNAE